VRIYEKEEEEALVCGIQRINCIIVIVTEAASMTQLYMQSAIWRDLTDRARQRPQSRNQITVVQLRRVALYHSIRRRINNIIYE
jgi:hypothetical protein